MFSKLLLSVGATLLVYGFSKVVILVLRSLRSPLRDLPGPKSPSWIYGHILEIWNAESAVLHEKWVEDYGSVLAYDGLFGARRLYTTDLRAINYILTHSDTFRKPEQVRYALTRMLGAGLLVVEGDQHKQQRKILNPAFGPVQIRELTGIFTEKANQLRDVWALQLAKQDERAPFDIMPWLSRVTLDVIGLAGFHYKFDSLRPDAKTSELSEAFFTVFKSAEFSLIPFLRAFFPVFRFFITKRDREVDAAKTIMNRIAEQLLRESKEAVDDSIPGREIEKSTLGGRDLLSLLIRANTAKDLPENQRLSDQDVLSQIPTFLVAGHETTSAATVWALYSLAIRPDIQSKLREEVFSLSTENPTIDELNSLKYLEFVVRETLRLHTPVSSTIRVSDKDDIIPLSTPFVDKRGKTHHGVRISKGDLVFVPILAINRSKALWGEDAGEFMPERWEAVPEAASGIPGVWGNMLTFLGGPHACIGYRFTLAEMKAILYSLIRAFEFELAVPADKISRKTSGIVQRPVVAGEKGHSMPMIITPYHRS